MQIREISLDAMAKGATPNRASQIRDAILEAEPEKCRGCPEAFERSYRIGQLALKEDWTPEFAAEWAWGNPGICCRSSVEIDFVPVEFIPSEARQLVLA